MPAYRETYRVPFGDTDGAGVVFYPNYYRWFDRMTHEFFRDLGHPLLAYGMQSVGPVLVETHCTYLTPVRYDDVVTLQARVGEVRERSFRIEHQIHRGEEVVTRGHEVRVWVELTAGNASSIPLPAGLRAALLAGNDTIEQSTN